MKRTWMIVGTMAVLLVGATAVAEARGFGPGTGIAAQPTYQSAATGGTYVQGTMGAQGRMAAKGRMGGQGMMGGQGRMGGQGMMGGTLCTGQNYDPAANAVQIEQMLVQHEAVLASLQAQLANTTDEARIAYLNQRIEMQQIMINWQQGKLAVVQTLTDEWPAGAITVAEYDVEFFTNATSTDTAVQSWIANRLAAAQQRLTYLEGQVN